jgi:hypothetical protein
MPQKSVKKNGANGLAVGDRYAPWRRSNNLFRALRPAGLI